MSGTSDGADHLARLVSLTNAARHDQAAAAQLSQIENTWLVEVADAEAGAAWDRARDAWAQGCSVMETEFVDVLSPEGAYLGYVEPVGIGWIAHVQLTDPDGGTEHVPLRMLYESLDAAAKSVVSAAVVAGKRSAS